MRTALYMRMSTDKQENSINSQQKVLELYAKSHKMEVVEKYIDEGISGRTAEKRPAFLRMIEDSAQGLFNAVLVYDSSRFARNLEESIVYKSVLKRNGIKLISATEPTLDDDSALITDAMLGALNEMYSRKLSKSVKRGMVYAAQKGVYQTPPPYGYKKSNGTVVIVDDEAEIVKKIFHMFIENPSWHGIAVKLNHSGVHKRNAYGWYSRDIKRMLQNSAYIGNVNYNGETYKGTHKPIIDQQTWTRAQDIISEKPSGKRRPPSTYKHWLSGLLKCAHCGGRMNFMRDSKGNTSYRCSKHANGACKFSNFISVPKLERLMKIALARLVSENCETDYEHMVPFEKPDQELESLKSALRKVNMKLARYKDAYSAGVDTLEEYSENKARCLKEEQEISKQIKILSNEANRSDEKIRELKESVLKLTDILYSDHYSVEQKSFALKSVVERIRFNRYTGEFTVYYYL